MQYYLINKTTQNIEEPGKEIGQNSICIGNKWIKCTRFHLSCVLQGFATSKSDFFFSNLCHPKNTNKQNKLCFFFFSIVGCFSCFQWYSWWWDFDLIFFRKRLALQQTLLSIKWYLTGCSSSLQWFNFKISDSISDTEVLLYLL